MDKDTSIILNRKMMLDKLNIYNLPKETLESKLDLVGFCFLLMAIDEESYRKVINFSRITIKFWEKFSSLKEFSNTFQKYCIKEVVNAFKYIYYLDVNRTFPIHMVITCYYLLVSYKKIKETYTIAEIGKVLMKWLMIYKEHKDLIGIHSKQKLNTGDNGEMNNEFLKTPKVAYNEVELLSLRFIYDFDEYDVLKLFDNINESHLCMFPDVNNLSKTKEQTMIIDTKVSRPLNYNEFLERIITNGLINIREDDLLLEITVFDYLKSISTTKETVNDLYPQLRVFILLKNLENYLQTNSNNNLIMKNLESCKDVGKSIELNNSHLESYFKSVSKNNLNSTNLKNVNLKDNGFISNSENKVESNIFTKYKNCKNCKLSFAEKR